VPDSAACNPTLGEGAGPTPTVAGAGRLPYTGPGDVFLQIMMGAIAMLAGFMAYRYASVSDRMQKARAAAMSAMRRRPRTGYDGAARNIQAEAEVSEFMRRSA